MDIFSISFLSKKKKKLVNLIRRSESELETFIVQVCWTLNKKE